MPKKMPLWVKPESVPQERVPVKLPTQPTPCSRHHS